MNPDAPAPPTPDDAPKSKPMSYRDAGVDIDAGEALVADIKEMVARTHRPEVLGGIGGFGALVGLPGKYKNPVLVSGTDGVGTKLRLGIDTGRVEGLGIDLVAMCVNDVLVNGAEPLFFLDYFATGKLENHVAGRVIRGIAEGCHQAGAALVGGETAEMPGMYARGDFDLAGFCVAVVERDAIIDGKGITPGHKLVALASSGPHSNGFSLIRRIVEHAGLGLDATLPGGQGETLGDALIAPTRIYVKSVLKLLAAGIPVAGMAHITGGGITENLPRVFPEGVGARVERSSWARPAVFEWLAMAGPVTEAEMLRTFNCGVGFILVLPPEAVAPALASLAESGETAWVCGEIVTDHPGEVAYA